MPSQPLFDMAGIDRTQVAVSPKRVGELNPQCGPMRQLDHVIWVAGDGSHGLGVKHVRDDEFWVEGHIPGRPLMPGVLMIEAAAQLCSVLQHLRQREREQPAFLGFTHCNNVSFRGQVVPGDVLYLMAMELKSGRRRFVSAAQGWVDGRLVFEGEVAGMVL